MRMGTRISNSALHRQRLRFGTSEHTTPRMGSALMKKPSLDLDYAAMEFKSILPPVQRRPSTLIVQHEDEAGRELELASAANSLSESLIERFDSMETEQSEPERRIVAVSLRKASDGTLGLKVTGTASGVYVDVIDGRHTDSQLRPGDRLVAVNGRSLENMAYNSVLALIKKAETKVDFLVSQTVPKETGNL
jgi:C-terminal processing protease CtpA/Prc